MLARARRNHAESGAKENISFVEGQITAVPLADGIADCIISNCVINLVPEAEKLTVFSEISRLLKPGGRVAVSDILARKPFPKQLRENIAAYFGCIAGCGGGNFIGRGPELRVLLFVFFRGISFQSMISPALARHSPPGLLERDLDVGR